VSAVLSFVSTWIAIVVTAPGKFGRRDYPARRLVGRH
jgi:hypothetical protein